MAIPSDDLGTPRPQPAAPQATNPPPKTTDVPDPDNNPRNTNATPGRDSGASTGGQTGAADGTTERPEDIAPPPPTRGQSGGAADSDDGSEEAEDPIVSGETAAAQRAAERRLELERMPDMEPADTGYIPLDDGESVDPVNPAGPPDDFDMRYYHSSLYPDAVAPDRIEAVNAMDEEIEAVTNYILDPNSPAGITAPQIEQVILSRSVPEDMSHLQPASDLAERIAQERITLANHNYVMGLLNTPANEELIRVQAGYQVADYINSGKQYAELLRDRGFSEEAIEGLASANTKMTSFALIANFATSETHGTEVAAIDLLSSPLGQQDGLTPSADDITAQITALGHDIGKQSGLEFVPLPFANSLPRQNPTIGAASTGSVQAIQTILTIPDFFRQFTEAPAPTFPAGIGGHGAPSGYSIAYLMDDPAILEKFASAPEFAGMTTEQIRDRFAQAGHAVALAGPDQVFVAQQIQSVRNQHFGATVLQIAAEQTSLALPEGMASISEDYPELTAEIQSTITNRIGQLTPPISDEVIERVTAEVTADRIRQFNARQTLRNAAFNSAWDPAEFSEDGLNYTTGEAEFLDQFEMTFLNQRTGNAEAFHQEIYPDLQTRFPDVFAGIDPEDPKALYDAAIRSGERELLTAMREGFAAQPGSITMDRLSNTHLQSMIDHGDDPLRSATIARIAYPDIVGGDYSKNMQGAPHPPQYKKMPYLLAVLNTTMQGDIDNLKYMSPELEPIALNVYEKKYESYMAALADVQQGIRPDVSQAIEQRISEFSTQETSMRKLYDMRVYLFDQSIWPDALLGSEGTLNPGQVEKQAFILALRKHRANYFDPATYQPTLNAQSIGDDGNGGTAFNFTLEGDAATQSGLGGPIDCSIPGLATGMMSGSGVVQSSVLASQTTQEDVTESWGPWARAIGGILPIVGAFDDVPDTLRTIQAATQCRNQNPPQPPHAATAPSFSLSLPTSYQQPVIQSTNVSNPTLVLQGQPDNGYDHSLGLFSYDSQNATGETVRGGPLGDAYEGLQTTFSIPGAKEAGIIAGGLAITVGSGGTVAPVTLPAIASQLPSWSLPIGAAATALFAWISGKHVEAEPEQQG